MCLGQGSSLVLCAWGKATLEFFNVHGIMASSAADGGPDAAFFEAGLCEEVFVPGARFVDVASSDDEICASAAGGAEAFAADAFDDEAFAAAAGAAEEAFVPGARLADAASDEELADDAVAP